MKRTSLREWLLRKCERGGIRRVAALQAAKRTRKPPPDDCRRNGRRTTEDPRPQSGLEGGRRAPNVPAQRAASPSSNRGSRQKRCGLCPLPMCRSRPNGAGRACEEPYLGGEAGPHRGQGRGEPGPHGPPPADPWGGSNWRPPPMAAVLDKPGVIKIRPRPERAMRQG